MKIKINGEEDIIQPEEGAKLGAVLEGLRVTMTENQMAITGLTLDGSILTRERESVLLENPVTDYVCLELEVIQKGLLARSVLGQVREHLPKIGESLVETTTHFQTGRVEEGYRCLSGNLEALALVQKCLINIVVLCESSKEGGGEKFEVNTASMSDFQEILEEANAALRGQDLVALGDILEYELGQILEQWEQEVQKLDELIDQLFSEDS
ncbi:MAG: hypothetical protein QF752_02430 [Planctomycetota bacterium]|nr:hypothetical protein [Planctomycetota bacterium]